MKPIRQRANAVTLFSICWTVFPVGLVVLVVDAWRQGHPDATGLMLCAVVVAVHALSISYAVHLWKTEKPTPASEVHGFTIDDLLDVAPEDIDVDSERAKLKAVAFNEGSATLGITALALIARQLDRISTKGLVATTVLFGGLFLLHIILQTARYLILKSRAV